MKRPAFRQNDPQRVITDLNGQPTGFLPSLKEQIALAVKDLNGIKMRLEKKLDNAEPACAIGEMVFRPESTTFAFDYLQDGSSSVVSQYVLKDGITYDIPIMFPPPGVMLIRFMKVRVYQRLFVPGCGPMQVPMPPGNFFLRNLEVFQTKKFSFPDNGASYTALARPGVRIYSRRLSYVWNLSDTKSGLQYADDLVPDMLLLPQGIGTPTQNATQADGGPLGTPAVPTGGYLEFRRPWLFERDGQLSFQFRPIMPVIQPAASDSYAPYPFEDRENGTAVRDSSVTVRIDMHGERYRTVRDAMKEGAMSR